MRAVFWSDDALNDVDSAVRFIARDNRRAAALVVDHIEATVDLLAQYPSGRPGRVTGTYERPVRRTPYIVAYTLSDTRLTVLRIIHGSRDWPEGE